MGTPPTAAVVVPVKSFVRAKVRLAGVLDDRQRVELARSMAEQVLVAAQPLPVWCVCDDPAVRDWALAHGALVEWTPGLGLNGAVQQAVANLHGRGVERVVVAHADLPFAVGLAALADTGPEEMVIVPDRRRRGSNVVSVPTGAGFRFCYGEDSFTAHLEQASRCGMSVRIEELERLGWDVDEPDDLVTPAHLGPLPGSAP